MTRIPLVSLLKTAAWVAALVLVLNWQDALGAFRGPVEYTGAAGTVTLYGTAWCGYCTKTRRFLESNDIPYADLDIETSADASRAFVALGGRGVPVVTVGDQIIHGYDLARLRKALEKDPAENL